MLVSAALPLATIGGNSFWARSRAEVIAATTAGSTAGGAPAPPRPPGPPRPPKPRPPTPRPLTSVRASAFSPIGNCPCSSRSAMAFTPPGVRTSRRSASARTSFGSRHKDCARSIFQIGRRHRNASDARTAAARTGTGPRIVSTSKSGTEADAGESPAAASIAASRTASEAAGWRKGHQRTRGVRGVQRTRELHGFRCSAGVPNPPRRAPIFGPVAAAVHMLTS